MAAFIAAAFASLGSLAWDFIVGEGVFELVTFSLEELPYYGEGVEAVISDFKPIAKVTETAVSVGRSLYKAGSRAKTVHSMVDGHLHPAQEHLDV